MAGKKLMVLGVYDSRYVTQRLDISQLILSACHAIFLSQLFLFFLCVSQSTPWVDVAGVLQFQNPHNLPNAFACHGYFQGSQSCNRGLPYYNYGMDFIRNQSSYLWEWMVAPPCSFGMNLSPGA